MNGTISRRGALLALVLASVFPRPIDAARPNFVVFLTDDLGWGDLGCYGHPVIRTPHIDAFARQGMKLTQCYSASSVCSPSRSAILTGRTPYRNGVFTWIPAGSEIHLRRSEVAIATLLRKQGYATCHVGKWHLNGKFNSPEQPQPDDHGYDWWLATQNNAAPSHRNPRNFVRNGEALGPLEGFSAVLVVEEAIRWLKEHRDPEKPFFLAVWTHEPHLPIESDPRFQALYPDIDDPGKRQHHANVTQIDHAFGSLTGALDELGLDRNTFVFFTSDNGPEGDGRKGRTRGSTGGLRGRKRALYEGGIRVPGIVRWPGRIPEGSVSDEPVIGSDVFATLSEIAGVALPADRAIDGASLVPLFEGRSVERRVPLYWRYHGAPHGLRVAMRRGDWKVLAADDFSRFELYNLREDPGESSDLAGKNPSRLEAMKKALTEHHLEVEKEGPDWWKGYGRRRAARKGGRLARGTDETSTFDVVRGCRVTKGGLGISIESNGEGFALHRLDKPMTGRVVFEVRYRTRTDATTKNGFLVFGKKPRNDELVKCGTAIGMGAHCVFQGPWSRLRRGAVLDASFDSGLTFAAEVTVDVEAKQVRMTVDGATVTASLPQDVDRIEYYGCYAKGTRTTFSPVTIRGRD